MGPGQEWQLENLRSARQYPKGASPALTGSRDRDGEAPAAPAAPSREGRSLQGAPRPWGGVGVIRGRSLRRDAVPRRVGRGRRRT